MSELKCPACRCRTFAKVDEPTLDGGWDNSKLIRCVECKRTYAAPPRPDAPSAGEWMPIETAPKDGHILAWKDGWGPTEAHWEGGDDEYHQGWVATHQDCDFTPTHWMPLPAPPQAYGGEG